MNTNPERNTLSGSGRQLGYSADAGYCRQGAHYNPVPGIRQSFAPTERRFVTPSGTQKNIRYGDRIFARVMMRGRTIVEFMIASVNDLTELLGELRRHARGVYGLTKLYVRNVSRGWSMERPLMLYREAVPGTCGPAASAVPAAEPQVSARTASASRMLCPWETH